VGPWGQGASFSFYFKKTSLWPEKRVTLYERPWDQKTSGVKGRLRRKDVVMSGGPEEREKGSTGKILICAARGLGPEGKGLGQRGAGFFSLFRRGCRKGEKGSSVMFGRRQMAGGIRMT